MWNAYDNVSGPINYRASGKITYYNDLVRYRNKNARIILKHFTPKGYVGVG